MSSRRTLLNQLRKTLQKERRRAAETLNVPEDPVVFAREILGFNPTFYQERILRDENKRICIRMSRQAGKTTTLAVRAIWFAATHPKTLSLIVSPSLRQSMIMMDRIHGFLMTIKPSSLRSQLIAKMQRTVIWFRNGSQIVALPNSPNLLRGYTAHQVFCDEAAFFRDDEMVFYNVLYPMLATTDGWLIVSSTPWGKNTAFYRFANDPHFTQHVITWREAVSAGVIKQSFIDEVRSQYPPERFRREYEAQFAEDADSYFPQDLITKCIDPSLEYSDFEEGGRGSFYVGVDFGKKVDYSVVAVVSHDGEMKRLVHMHRFPLDTAYSDVIGYVKVICEKYDNVVRVLCDQTGVGEYIVEDMRNLGIPGVDGIILSQPRKEEVLGFLKQEMHGQRILIPYDADLIAEINNEEYSLTKDGKIRFSHPEGTHDDRLWALALAVYAARAKPPRLWIVGGKRFF